MKVTENKKTSPSVSTGKLDKRVDQEKASDSSAFEVRSMGFAYEGEVHMSERGPIVGQQDLLRYCLSGVRRKTSIRCDGLLWKNFVERCREEGLSSCGVVEKLLLGWLVGVQSGRVPEMTVVVDAPRIVKRVRRRQLVFEDEVSVSGVGAGADVGKPVCYFRGCDGEVVGQAVFEGGKPVFVCVRHYEELRVHPKWKVFQ